MSLASKERECPECGTRLAQGVCPSCALGQLFSDSGTGGLGVRDGLEGGSLDMEFGRYVLRTKLASGGMGVVYVAEDAELKRRVALKMIRGAMFAEEGEVARFKIEAEAAAGLDHPNIVPIYEIGACEGQPFYTMKLIEGESLAARLKRAPGGRLGAVEAAELLAPIARAVQHAHQRGVLHRDLKPGNILIDATGVPWLSDFGLAKMVGGESSLTLSTDALGTPDYMSPEVVAGSAREVSTANDIWALGVILWQALCGVLPFQGKGTMETMRLIEESEPTVPDGLTVDGDLLTLALRCMEKDAGRRPASAGMVADELERKLRGEPLLVRKVTTGERLLKWVKRKPAWAALGAAVLVGGFSSGSLWWKVESTEHSLSESEALWEKAMAMSQVMQLAMDARQEVEDDPALSVLLAVESLERSERHLGKVLPETATALFETLQRVGGWDVSPNGVRQESQGQAFISRFDAINFPVAFSPDGRWCLTMDPGGECTVDGEKVRALDAGVFDLTKKGAAGPAAQWTLWEEHYGRSRVIWTADSRRLVAVGNDGVVHLWTPDLGGGGATAKELVGELEMDGFATREVWLRRGRDGGEVEGLVIYHDRLAGDLDKTERFRAAIERFSVEERGGEMRLVRRGVQPMPMAFADATTCEASEDLRWVSVLLGEERENRLVRVGEGGEVEGQALLGRWEEGMILATFDPAGRWLAVRREGWEVACFDLGAGTAEAVAASGRVLYRHDAPIESMAFSAGGDRLALAGYTPDVVVLELGDGDPGVMRLRTGSRQVFGVDFSDDGRWLAAGGRESTVSLWQLDERGRGAVVRELRGLPTPALDVAFSPGSASLVASGMTAHYRRWPIGREVEGYLPVVLSGSESGVRDLAKSPDGRLVAAAHVARGTGETGVPGGLGFAKVVDTLSGDSMVLATHGEIATGVAFSPDGRWLASSGRDSQVKVWASDAVLGAFEDGRGEPDPVYVFDTSMARPQYERRLAFRPGGVLYCTCGDGFLFEWDLSHEDAGEEPTGYLVHSQKYLLPDVEVSPDGRWMAVARHGWDSEPVEGSNQRLNMVLLFDLRTAGTIELVAELPARFLGETKLSFSAHGRWLAAGACDTGATVWDLEADDVPGSRIQSPVTAHNLEAVAFSPDDRWLAIGASDGRICLWDWRGEGDVWTIRTDHPQSSLVWLDHTRLASGGASGGIRVWETDLLKLRELARDSAGRKLVDSERQIFQIPKNFQK